MRLLPFTMSMFVALVGVYGCGNGLYGGSSSIKVGGLYAAKNDDGSWSVMKVLAVSDDTVHLRAYANKFQELPRDIDPATLTLGGVDDPAGFGIGHFPIAKNGFLNDKPTFLKVVPVSDDELEGYRIYLDAMQEDAQSDQP